MAKGRKGAIIAITVSRTPRFASYPTVLVAQKIPDWNSKITVTNH